MLMPTLEQIYPEAPQAMGMTHVRADRSDRELLLWADHNSSLPISLHRLGGSQRSWKWRIEVETGKEEVVSEGVKFL